MIKDNNVKDSIQKILDSLDTMALGTAISRLRTFVDENRCVINIDDIDNVDREYNLMLHYWGQGYEDPQNLAIFDGLRKKAFECLIRMIALYEIKNEPFFKNIYNVSIGSDFSDDIVLSHIQNYVADVAMLSLENKDTARVDGQELYRKHDDFRQTLFCHILVSEFWSESRAKTFNDILLSPITDAIDAQLIISAMTIALVCYPDRRKFETLVNVYMNSDNETIRQKAFVGWVFALASPYYLDFYYADILSRTVENNIVCSELIDLQKQVVLCMEAEKDHSFIQKDIIPDIMKGQNFTFTSFGIKEKEEDPLDDILNPEASDKAMEKMEESIRKMVDMQKAGSDIYFGGFSQMKRYPFFYKIANWFMPFYIQNPEISKSVDKFGNASIISTMIDNGPFCDSDKYSFAIALSSIINQIPKEMREMLDGGEISPMMIDVDKSDPVYIRRMILHDMYRFFRLFQYRDSIKSPFDEDTFFFFDDDKLSESLVGNAMHSIFYFMLKHKKKSALECLYHKISNTDDTGLLMMEAVYQNVYGGNNSELISCLKKILDKEPDNKRALKMLGSAYLKIKEYSNAALCYERIYMKDSENKDNTLLYCMALAKNEEYEKAINLLYKLSVETPKNNNVTRVLAWTLMCMSRYSQAEKEYMRLLEHENVETGDWLNYGYCQWLQGHIADAAGKFYNFCRLSDVKNNAELLIEEFYKDSTFLYEHGITTRDFAMMSDLVSLKYGS
ncbi:MAG: tetratricopeptide repeat protein [Prevotella sp.]